MKNTPLYVAIVILSAALVASLLTRSSASATQSQAAATSPAVAQPQPTPQAPPAPKAARKLGVLPEAMREAIQAAILDVNITGPTAAKAFAEFQKSSAELKADKAARAKLSSAIEKAASHFDGTKLDASCFFGALDPQARDACAKRGKLWGITDSGEVEAQ